MIPGRWWRRDAAGTQARELYEAIVAQARRTEFYAALGVPDTLGGRFELVVLHMFLAQRRLRGSGAMGADAGRALAQALIEVMFDDMDASLRELGVGDLGVGRRVQAMAEGFYGRAAAFEAALGQGEAELEAALRRNLYGGVEPAAGQLAAMVRYVRAEAPRPALAGMGASLRFGEPPAI
jgi:cytochrome b pre-mRNA-processing protein 3